MHEWKPTSLQTENTLSCVDGIEGIGKDQGKHSHELHHNIQSRTTGILEGISDGVTDNSGLVDVRSFSLQFTVRAGLFNVLLGIVPSSSRVGHTNGQLHGSNKGTYEKARHGGNSKEDSSQERGEDHHGTGRNHLAQTGLGGDSDAGIVIRTFRWVGIQKVGLFVKLTLHLQDHGHGCLSDTLHGQGGKRKRDHSSHNQKGESQGFQHVDTTREQFVTRSMSDTGDKGTKQGQRHQSSRTNGETLSDSSSCVSSSVKGIGLFTDSRVEFSHFGNTSSIVTDRSIDINRQTSGQVGEETNRSEGNTVHIAHGEGSINHKGKNQHGNDGRLVPESNTVDHVGSSTSLTGLGDFANGLVTVTCVILGHQTDNESTDDTHGHTEASFPRVKGKNFITNSTGELERFRQVINGSVVHGRDHDNGSRDELNLERHFHIFFSLDSRNVCGNEGADQAHKNTNGTDNDRENHGVPVSGSTNTASNHKSCARRFGKGSEKITSHTSNITHVITYIVSNSSRVSWVILGDSVHDLSDKIGTNVGSLCVDTTADTAKHGNDGSTKTVTRDAFGEVNPFLRFGIMNAEDEHGNVKHQESCCTEGKTHDGTRTESRVETGRPAWFLCRNSGTNIAVHGHLHSKVATSHGRQGTQHE
mmetsp:Transcript_12765/g.28758  ORF Transcript_12765/g.28758 Transcript_12765/m.28758 type:complete len:643 (+) Transcript_12765:1150-3078(+)